MTSRDFCYWLQGFFEVANPKDISCEQTQMIKNHLAMVFVHEIDPSFGDKAKQDKLTETHGGSASTPLSDLLKSIDQLPKFNC